MERDKGTQAEYLKALAHPTRISILELLDKEGRCVTNIGEKLNLFPSDVKVDFPSTASKIRKP
jgi:DNA-binding transcriptional ArsR family regulator